MQLVYVKKIMQIFLQSPLIFAFYPVSSHGVEKSRLAAANKNDYNNVFFGKARLAMLN